MKLGNLLPDRPRSFWFGTLATVLLLIAAFAAGVYFTKPAPPDTIVMGTGTPDSGYHMFGKRYRDILSREGVTVELRTSAGSQANLSRLMDENSELDVGFF